VIEGISATARVITSAALIMISVFAAFVLATTRHQDVRPRPGRAVLIDATVVRIVLVPATMKLLGDWNWWLPAGWTGCCPTSTSRAARPCPSPSTSPAAVRRCPPRWSRFAA
jgi:RND superfamily putative drug exporter